MDWMSTQRFDVAPQESSPRRSARIGELQEQVATLLPRLRIAVIFGGSKAAEGAVINQTVNSRSWKSYEAVANDIAAALQRLGCGQVLVVPEDMRLGERLKQEDVHLAWLNSGGVQGYSPVAHAPAMLEMLGLPYIGHDPLTAASLDNKLAFKRQIKAAGIPTASFLGWHPASGPLDPARNEAFQRVFAGWTGGFVVKPVSGRASLNVMFAESQEALPELVEHIFLATHNQVLIETFLPGREYCVAVCGPVIARGRALDRLGEAFAFAEVERVLDPDERIFTSMDKRPITRDRVRPLNAAEDDADAPVRRGLRNLGRRVFADLALETLVRLDVRANEHGELFVLEANPKPDLKAPEGQVTSLICAGLEEQSMDYDDLILSLLADRLDRLFSHRRGAAHQLLALAGPAGELLQTGVHDGS